MRACLLCLALLVLVVKIWTYNQSDYLSFLERIEIPSFNPKYINISYRNFKYNRTMAAFNASFDAKLDLGNHPQINIQAYKFQSNEYRLFPMTFSRDLCHTINRDDFGVKNIYSCGKGPRCPFVKGHYKICNWHPDYAKFPPFIPLGQYRIDVRIVYFSDEIAYIQSFVKIESAKWYGG